MQDTGIVRRSADSSVLLLRIPAHVSTTFRDAVSPTVGEGKHAETEPENQNTEKRKVTGRKGRGNRKTNRKDNLGRRPM